MEVGTDRDTDGRTDSSFA